MTTTVDMEDEVGRLKDELAQIESEAAESDSDSEEWKTLEEEHKQLTGQLRAFESKMNAWGGSEFVISSLSFTELMAAKDEVQQKSQRGSNPRTGYYKVKVLEMGVEEGPPGFENVKETDVPYAVGEWLYDCIDEYTTTGEVSLGNSSLEKALGES
jgi:hypothetical protein